MTFRLLVLVGTDHHPFDRLVTAVDSWLETQPADSVSAVVQYGTSAAPRVASGQPVYGRAELDDLLAQADAAIAHGGPGTLADVRRHGLLPIVVPRDPMLGEHVDDHQQRFARRMAAEGAVRLCEKTDELPALLDRALREPGSTTISADGEALRAREVAAAVQRVGAILDALMRS